VAKQPRPILQHPHLRLRNKESRGVCPDDHLHVTLDASPILLMGFAARTKKQTDVFISQFGRCLTIKPVDVQRTIGRMCDCKAV
jgi:hypothetical protein